MSRASASPLEPPPRKAHLRRGIKNVRRAYRTVFALVILVFGGWAALDGFRWYDLTFQTKTAAGKILKKQTIPRQVSQEFRLEYTFTAADGTVVLHETTVAPPIFDRVAEDRAVPIVYLPENPKLDHWLFNNNDERAKWMYLTIGHGLAALLAVIVLRVVDRPLQRELRLARYGLVTQGRSSQSASRAAAARS